MYTYPKLCPEISYLRNKGVYYKTLDLQGYFFKYYVPSKKILLVQEDLPPDFLYFFISKGVKILRTKDFSHRELYSEIMNYGSQEVNFVFKFREFLIRNKINFRYKRLFKNLDIRFDFYFKNLNLCLDFSLECDIMKARKIRNRGINYQVFRFYDFKEAQEYVLNYKK